MLDQVQHILRTRLSIEDIKDLLIKDEKHYAILNPKHQVWLCVNHNSATELAHSLDSAFAQELADKIFVLRGAVVVRLLFGVTTEYYLYRKRISKKKAEREYGTEFVNMVEEFKGTYETYFKQIKKEEYAKKYAKLAEVLGEEKANYLLNTDYNPEAKLLHLVSIDGFFSNTYGDMAENTTTEERAQLLELGIKVQI